MIFLFWSIALVVIIMTVITTKMLVRSLEYAKLERLGYTDGLLGRQPRQLNHTTNDITYRLAYSLGMLDRKNKLGRFPWVPKNRKIK